MTTSALAERLRAINDDLELNSLGKRIPEIDQAADLLGAKGAMTSEELEAHRVEIAESRRARSLQDIADAEQWLSWGMEPQTILGDLGLSAGAFCTKLWSYGRHDLAKPFLPLYNEERRKGVPATPQRRGLRPGTLKKLKAANFALMYGSSPETILRIVGGSAEALSRKARQNGNTELALAMRPLVLVERKKRAAGR